MNVASLIGEVLDTDKVFCMQQDLGDKKVWECKGMKLGETRWLAQVDDVTAISALAAFDHIERPQIARAQIRGIEACAVIQGVANEVSLDCGSRHNVLKGAEKAMMRMDEEKLSRIRMRGLAGEKT